MNQLPKWDKKNRFSSEQDALNHGQDLLKKSEEYLRQITEISKVNFCNAIAVIEKIQSGLHNLSAYSTMCYAEDTHQSSEFIGRITAIINRISSIIDKFVVLIYHSDDNLTECAQEYSTFIQCILNNKIASRDIEEIINKYSKNTTSFVSQEFQKNIAQISFEGVDGALLSYSQAQINMRSTDRATRKNALYGLIESTAPIVEKNTQLLNLYINTINNDASLRGYETSLHSSANREGLNVDVIQYVTQKIIDTSDMHEHILDEIKLKLLKRKTIPAEDIRISFHNVNYSWDCALRYSKSTFEKISEDAKNKCNLIIDSNMIDAGIYQNKASGAFCIMDYKPAILMNFGGTLRCISTLVHEMGHGIHGYTSYNTRKNSITSQSHSVYFCESFSMFPELILHDILNQEIKSPYDKLCIGFENLTYINAGLLRQSQFHKFEYFMHQEIAKHGYISHGDLTKKFNTIMLSGVKDKNIYNDNILEKFYSVLWPTIPHYVLTPFYVFNYTFGQLLAYQYRELHKQDPKSFAKAYTAILETPDQTKHPAQSLQDILGINIDDASMWEISINAFIADIRKLKDLSDSL